MLKGSGIDFTRKVARVLSGQKKNGENDRLNTQSSEIIVPPVPSLGPKEMTFGNNPRSKTTKNLLNKNPAHLIQETPESSDDFSSKQPSEKIDTTK